MGSIRLLNVWPRWCHDMRTDVHIPVPRGSECGRCIAILAAEKFCSSQGILARRWSRLFYVWPRWCHDMRAHLHISMPRGSFTPQRSSSSDRLCDVRPSCDLPCVDDPAAPTAAGPSGCSMYGPGGAM